MDPLTHALSGAALARALPKHPLPGPQFALLILLTLAPDADFALKPVSDIIYLEHHRGITHSLLMLPLWVWLIYSLLARRGRRALSPLLISLALVMHIMLDLITSFGTMLMAPFSDRRAAMDMVFIIDPLLTACLLLPLLAAIRMKRRRRLLAASALALMIAYLGLCAWQHQRALDLLAQARPDALARHALPLPFSPFHWQLIATYQDHYERAGINLMPGFSGTAPLFPERLTRPFLAFMHAPAEADWQRLPRMQAMRLDAGLPGLDFYDWFARFPVLLEADRLHYEFGDLRFAAGIAGVDSSFRLRVEHGERPRAWLIWRGDARTGLE